MSENGIGERLIAHRDRLEFKDDNHRVLTSSKKGKKGRWERHHAKWVRPGYLAPMRVDS